MIREFLCPVRSMKYLHPGLQTTDMDPDQFLTFLYGWIALAIILFPIQLWGITAPYGRHIRTNWGPVIDNKWGWFIMEIVSPLVFGYFFLTGPNPKSGPMWVFFTLWILHYLNRSIIYPLRTRTSGKKIPVLIVLFAVVFNTVNGWTNGYFLGYLSKGYPDDWFLSPQFLAGFVLFLVGAGINLSADNYLLSLRKPGQSGYILPAGKLFNRISCPNHLGEILEWTGFAILTWNLAAAGFAIWTAANLIPRAMSHHRWYRNHFPDYPLSRKAVIPFIF